MAVFSYAILFAAHAARAAAADSALAPAARAELDSALAVVRRASLWRDTVTWRVVEPEVRAAAAGATTARGVYPAIRLLLQRLGDHHSGLMEPAVASAWSAGRLPNDPPLIGNIGDSLGYVAVPGYSGGERIAIRAYAEHMHQVLAASLPRARCGWVVDLRGNGGGNMRPMLAGLRPFLGTGALGTFEGPPGTRGSTWTATAPDVTPPAALAPLERAWVAVLTGPRTVSSGEVVAISFRGRPRTRSFGAPTGGLSTANTMFLLPDGARLVLTVSVDADRTGRRYGGAVEPDELVGPASGDPVSGAAGGDDALARAEAWVVGASGCRAPQ